MCILMVKSQWYWTQYEYDCIYHNPYTHKHYVYTINYIDADEDPYPCSQSTNKSIHQ